MTGTFEDAVFAYVNNGVRSEKEEIAQFNRWTELTAPLTVYRGQPETSDSPDTYPPLFSTTTDKSVASTFAKPGRSGGVGCVWKIELQPGIRIINVKKVLENAKEESKKRYENLYKWEQEIIVESGETLTIVDTLKMNGVCQITATYAPRKKTELFVANPKPEEPRFEVFTLGNKEYVIEYNPKNYTVGRLPPPTPNSNPNSIDLEAVDGGKRRKTRRKFKMPRKMSRKYCKKTSCKKMGFTQKASCRPWKNCY